MTNMITVDLTEVLFDPQQGCYFIPTESTLIRSSEELRSAIREGSYKDALDFISNMDKNTVGEPDSHGQTALHWAALCDNEELCKALIEKMDPEAIYFQTYESHQTALHLAVRGGSTRFIKLLMASKFAIQLAETEDKYGQTPLHWAISRGNLEMCQELYRNMSPKKITFPMRNEEGRTVLHCAVIAGNLELVKLLISNAEMAKELVKTVDSAGQTPLHWAAGLGQFEICEILYDKMTPEQIWIAMDPEGRKLTALHFAVQGKNQKIVEFLLKDNDVTKGLVGLQDKDGQTALHWAAGLGQFEICKALYGPSKSANVLYAQTKEHEYTVLHLAVHAKQAEIVCLFTKEFEDVKGLVGVVDRYGQTALHWAAGLGQFEICKALYGPSKSANVLYVQTIDNKYTVLHLAVHAKQAEIVRLFTKEFEDVKGLVGVVDRYGQTALHWAVGTGCYEICKILYDKMSPEQIRIAEGRKQTALHFAVQAKDQRMVEILISNSVVRDQLIGIPDYNNETALDWAKKLELAKIEELLVAH